MNKLIWFRSDLRVMDNRALSSALKGGFDGGVYALYVATPKQWDSHDWGEPKVSFMLRCVDSLSKNLRELGVPLILEKRETFGELPKLLLKLCQKLDVSEVYLNKEYELNEIERDKNVKEALEPNGIEIFAYDDQTCLAPDHPELRTGGGRPYSVFTPFMKKWIDIIDSEGLPSVNKRPKKRKISKLPTELLKYESVSELNLPFNTFKEEWPGGERNGLERLKSFAAKGIEHYGDRRDFPSISGTSRISPYLAAGALSARKCLAYAVRANEDQLTMDKNGEMIWASEIIWREFYRHVLFHNQRICKYGAYREEVDKVAWRYDEDEFERWCSGMTGYPLVDAAMRQLNSTGWMHNRLRMVVSMFLTKHLLIDWRRGEKYFNQKLVDADFASNNGGWQWSSSTGTDAQPYFRIFNPYSQSEKFDKEGSFIKEFVPELTPLSGKALHKPEAKLCEACGYPSPIIEHPEGRERALNAFKRA